jgi:hypothetical protein
LGNAAQLLIGEIRGVQVEVQLHEIRRCPIESYNRWAPSFGK